MDYHETVILIVRTVSGGSLISLLPCISNLKLVGVIQLKIGLNVLNDKSLNILRRSISSKLIC